MMKLTKTQNTLLTNILIGCGLLFGLFVFLIFPKDYQVKRLQSSVDSSLADYQRIQNAIYSAQHSGEKFQSILKRLEDYRRKAPYQEFMPQLLAQLTTTAQRNGLKVLSFVPKDQKIFLGGDNKPFQEGSRTVQIQTVQLEFQGTFFAIGNFLSLLEEGPYIILLEKVIIQDEKFVDPETRTKRELVVKLTLNILTLSGARQLA